MPGSGVEESQPVVSIATAPRQTRHQLVHRFDGRYGALQPAEIRSVAGRLARQLPADELDAIVGIPEGGTVPAFAVAEELGLPLVLATRTVVDLTQRISFDEPHVQDGGELHVYELAPGSRVAIVEDEITTGRTIVNAVTALRAAGVEVVRVATVFLVEHPATLARIGDAGIDLVVAMPIDGRYLDRVGADGG